MLLWRNPTQYMCGCGFGNHIEPSYWTLKWFVIFLPLVVTFHLFRSLWGHCGQLSKKCVGPGATRESPYGHLGPLWPQTHLIPCGKANRSHTGKFGTPHWDSYDFFPNLLMFSISCPKMILLWKSFFALEFGIELKKKSCAYSQVTLIFKHLKLQILTLVGNPSHNT